MMIDDVMTNIFASDETSISHFIELSYIARHHVQMLVRSELCFFFNLVFVIIC